MVGPNGSGKSNFVEAMRWVLGEQNARVMRCEKKMEEVIFHGSEQRPPQGFAEVSLLFDNSDRQFGHDGAELSLTRRLYRSGESEYYINKMSVRLKDLQTLLMDTGLGSNGYSIIAQGMISRIMSEKPVDRRRVFEEASGISKYRSRKDEAERKLAAAMQNLEHVSGKIEELEPQVESLKAQAETAKRFLLLRDELRILEISLWMSELDKLRAGKSKLTEEFHRARDAAEAGRQKLEELYTELERMEERSLSLSRGAEEARQGLSALENALKTAEGEAGVLENDLRHNAESIESLLAASEKAENVTQSLEEQRIAAENNITELTEALRYAETSLGELAAVSEQLSAQSTDLSVRADALRARQALGQAALGEVRLRIGSADARRNEWSARRQALISEKESRLDAKSAASSALEISRKALNEARESKAELENVISGYKLRAENRSAKLAERTTALDKLDRLLHEKTSRQALLSDLEREHEGNHAVNMVMKSPLTGLYGTVAELIRTGDETALAVEVALGAALQNIVTETEENARDAIAFLKERNGGRATFLPLTTVNGTELDDLGGEGYVGIASRLVRCDDKFNGIVKSLLGRTVICRTLDDAIALERKHSHRLRIVSLDGQIISAGGAITGGSAGKRTGILSRKNELDRLGDELARLTERRSAAAAELSEAERAAKSAAYDLEVALGELREANEEVLTRSAEVNHQEVLLSNLELSLEITDRELDDIAAKFQSQKTEQEAADLEIEGYEKLIAELENELSVLAGGQNEAASGRQSLSEQQASLREEISGINARLEGQRQILAGIAERLRDSSGDDKTRADTLADYQKAGVLLEERIKAKHAEIGEKALEIDASRAAVEAVDKRRLQLEAERNRLTRGSREQSEQNILSDRAAQKLENSLLTSQKDEDAIISRLWEQYELTVSRARELRTELESGAKAARRTAELKKEISSLGPVNMAAVDEYAKIGERYDYLVTQREDALGSKNELDKIISDITREMRELFTEQFTRIQAHFSQTFTDIFGGGRAAIELEDERDVLEAGIEIQIQPPGKMLSPISQLSGGEQSLGAIALYFAMFKARPAPFCVLDEIDHALDEVNVARFAAYLKKLAETTQYIVITHRRGTMEQANTLYGVTSRQGSSRVIGMTISDVEDKLNISID